MDALGLAFSGLYAVGRCVRVALAVAATLMSASTFAVLSTSLVRSPLAAPVRSFCLAVRNGLSLGWPTQEQPPTRPNKTP